MKGSEQKLIAYLQGSDRRLAARIGKGSQDHGADVGQAGLVNRSIGGRKGNGNRKEKR